MSKIKRVEDCRTHKEFVRWATQHGGIVEPGGRHTKVRGPKGGMAPIPNHRGDLATGTRYSIIKMFVAIGLACILLLAIV